MKNTLVKVKKEFTHTAFSEILPINYKTELIPKLSTEEKTIVNETTKFDSKLGKHIIVNPAVIAPIGTYEGFTFVGANGSVYNDKTIEYMIGYVPLSEIFDKI